MVTHFGQHSFFAVSLDEATHHGMQTAGVPSLLFNSFLQMKDAIGIYKYVVSYALHLIDIDFIFSEMDVFWSNNPLHVVPRNVDIAISAHSYSHEVNIGFWYSKATLKTLRIYEIGWQALASVDNYSNIVGAMDQKVMTSLLDGNAHYYATPENTSVLGLVRDRLVFDTSVEWSYLPFELLWHNMGADVDAWVTPFTRVASHLTFGLTHPEHRMYAAKALGLWREKRYTSCTVKSITYTHHEGIHDHSSIETAAQMALHANRSFFAPSAQTPHVLSLSSLSPVVSLVDHNYYERCSHQGKAVAWHVIRCDGKIDGQARQDFKKGTQLNVLLLNEPSIDDLKQAVDKLSHADVIVLDRCRALGLRNSLSFCDFDGNVTNAHDFCAT
jgi:hypothetical protein